MTISEETNKIRANGNGVTTEFAFSFPIFNEEDIKVYKIDTSVSPEEAHIQTVNVDYTVEISKTIEGGTITYTTAPTNDEDSFIKRLMEYNQGTDIPNNRKFPEEDVENAIDKSRMIDIQLKEEQDRTLKLSPFTQSITNLELPEPEASKAIGYNNTADKMVNLGGVDLDTVLATTFGQQVVTTANALALRNLIELGILDNVEFNNIIVDKITASIFEGLPEATKLIKGISYLKIAIKRIILSNGTDTEHDINFTSEVYDFDDGSGQAVSEALTKQIDNIFEEGDNKGGLDTGTVANDTFYDCYAIYNPTSKNSDYLSVVNGDAPIMPSGYTKKKFIGNILTEGSANIRQFTQKQNEFFWVDPISEYSANATSQDLLISAPPNTKVKLDVQADINSNLNMQIRSLVLGTNFYSNLSNDWAVGDWSGGKNNRPFEILTDSISEIRLQVSAGGNIKLHTLGWYDYDI